MSYETQQFLTKIREWVDGEDTGEWPAPPEYTEYRVGGQMRLDVLARLGRAADDPCDVRMIQGVIEGGYSEFTVEHDYPIEVWVHEGKQAQKVFDYETYWQDDSLAAFLRWIADPSIPPAVPDCTCSAGNDLPFPAQHATLCPRFSCGRTDGSSS